MKTLAETVYAYFKNRMEQSEESLNENHFKLLLFLLLYPFFCSTPPKYVPCTTQLIKYIQAMLQNMEKFNAVIKAEKEYEALVKETNAEYEEKIKEFEE